MKCGFLHFVFILKDILFQKKKKCGKMRMLNHGNEVGEYT